LAVLVVVQAELHPLGVLREEREVRPLAVPARTEREGAAGPDLRNWTHDAPRRRGAMRVSSVPSATELHLLPLEVGDELRAAAAQPQQGAVELGLELPRQLAPQPQQTAVEREPLLVLLPGELRVEERLLRLGIGHVLAGEGGEALELLPPALARRLGDE